MSMGFVYLQPRRLLGEIFTAFICSVESPSCESSEVARDSATMTFSPLGIVIRIYVNDGLIAIAYVRFIGGWDDTLLLGKVQGVVVHITAKIGESFALNCLSSSANSPNISTQP